MIINGGFKIMGTKRVGLARTQALVEGLKRNLTMGGARFTNVKGVEMNVYSSPISADGSGGFGDSTGLAVPANSIITGLGVVVSTVLAFDSATLGVNFGTTEAGHELNVVDADGLATSATSLAAGKGTSTHSHEKTAMGGAAVIVFDPNIAYSTSERTVYGTITTSSGNVDTGAVIFWATYRLVA
jgi:hypothetical protein